LPRRDEGRDEDKKRCADDSAGGEALSGEIA
jgi:hypothetical protein